MMKMAFFGRRVARLPDRGTLLVATDLQGNLQDYRRLKELHAAEPGAILALTGDLVHGPSKELNEPGGWPSHLGTAYRDESVALILDFINYVEGGARAVALIGNHEHAHIGGPVVAKFYADEAAVLDEALGEHRARVHQFFQSMPLIAVSDAGVVLTHGAPRSTEATLEGFEDLRYGGYEFESIHGMYARDTLGALLWARAASPQQAQELLQVASPTGKGFVAYGHDVVREGYEKVGEEQICFSTSYGLFDTNKVYLRLDLGKKYAGTSDLAEGREILKLYD